MRQWSESVVLALALAMATGVACKSENSDDGKSEKDDKDTKKKKKKKDEDADDDDKGKKGKKTSSDDKDKGDKKDDVVDADALLKAASESPNEGSGVLKVDLSNVPDEKVPALGGGAPPQPTGGGQLEWLAVGPLEVPNPGWAKNAEGGVYTLLNKEKHAAILFTDFDTPENGLKRVDEIVKAMSMTEAKWKDPKPVTIGPDKLKGAVGVGHAKTASGKGATLFYVLVKTGAQTNIVGIGGAGDDSGKESFMACLDIIDSIRKKQ